MDKRLVMLVAAAFVGGAVVAAALLWEGSPLGSGGAAPLLVRIENTGTHTGTVAIEVTATESAFQARSELPLPAGETVEHRVERRLSGSVAIKLTVQWAEGGRSARGDTTAIVEPERCAADDTMLVAFRVDTTNGVGFRPGQRGCR